MNKKSFPTVDGSSLRSMKLAPLLCGIGARGIMKRGLLTVKEFQDFITSITALV